MNLHKLVCGVSAFLMLGFYGCVDNDYDLSDIDTTTRLTVENLVLPVNIDPVTMGDIITSDENSRIRPVTIGYKTFFALTEQGQFNSEPIYIDPVHADAPHIESTEDKLEQVSQNSPLLSVLSAGSQGLPALTYNITEMGNDFSYHAFDVDKAIEEITAAYTNTIRFTINLNALNLDSEDVDMVFTDLVIAVPKGLAATASVGSYNPANGLWTIPSYTVQGHTAKAVLSATAIDFTLADARINESHQFIFNGELRIRSGLLTISPKTMKPLPETLNFRVDYNLDDIEIKAFDGIINYQLEGMSIAPIYLNNIPDFLNCESTHISLHNPQLYLSITNPLALDNLTIQTGLSITAKRQNYRPLEFAIDNGPITLSDLLSDSPLQNFVLAPHQEELNIPDDFNHRLQFVPFTSFSDILTVPGNNTYGLPDELIVNVVDPQIPRQHVNSFKLGRQINGVNGRYMLVAPLDLDEGSVITYVDRIDGWSSEDLEALTVTKLNVSATVTNETDMQSSMTIYPIDVNGNVLTGVSVNSNTLAANGTTDVEFELTGEVVHLDGVEIRVTVTAGSENKALTPSQSLILSNVRARVSGYYQKEL